MRPRSAQQGRVGAYRDPCVSAPGAPGIIVHNRGSTTHADNPARPSASARSVPLGCPAPCGTAPARSSSHSRKRGPPGAPPSRYRHPREHCGTGSTRAALLDGDAAGRTLWAAGRATWRHGTTEALDRALRRVLPRVLSRARRPSLVHVRTAAGCPTLRPPTLRCHSHCGWRDPRVGEARRAKGVCRLRPARAFILANARADRARLAPLGVHARG